MKGIIEGLLYVQGDLGLTIDQVSDILEIDKDKINNIDEIKYIIDGENILINQIKSDSKKIEF